MLLGDEIDNSICFKRLEQVDVHPNGCGLLQPDNCLYTFELIRFPPVAGPWIASYSAADGLDALTSALSR